MKLTSAPTVRHHRNPPQKTLKFMLQFISICLLFMVPEMVVSYSEHGTDHPLSPMMYAKTAIFICAFYASFYFTTDPSSDRRHAFMRFLLQNLLIFVIAMTTMTVLSHVTCPPAPHVPEPPPHHGRSPLVPILRDTMILILTIALSLAIRFFQNIQQVEHQRREAETREREAELQQLKAQLNPHFLFNTLNTIYALIDIAPQKAQAAIHRLSKMLRHMLYDNSGIVTLADEFRFAENYIDLMMLRLPPSLPVEVNFDIGDSEQLPIAPLLFINIIENAFKHGSQAPNPGLISISLTARDNVVTCATANDYAPDRTPSANGSGIGLANLRRRLELQYSGRYSLTVDRAEKFRVELRIDLSAPPDMPSNSASPSSSSST